MRMADNDALSKALDNLVSAAMDYDRAPSNAGSERYWSARRAVFGVVQATVRSVKEHDAISTSTPTSPAWRTSVQQLIRDLAATGVVFTVDDLRYRAARCGFEVATSTSAWGGAIRAAKLAGVIVPHGRRKSSRYRRVVAAWIGAEWTGARRSRAQRTKV